LTNLYNQGADGAASGKVERVIEIFKHCQAGEWATQLKDKYYTEAMQHLQDVAVLSSRKVALESLAKNLMNREN
jgi:geranylgeranyl diphosphate synthase type II